MEQPTNAALAGQIETIAQTVAKIYEQMATKDELHSLETKMDTRFDTIEQRLDRIEKSHGYRLATLERDVAILKA